MPATSCITHSWSQRRSPRTLVAEKRSLLASASFNIRSNLPVVKKTARDFCRLIRMILKDRTSPVLLERLTVQKDKKVLRRLRVLARRCVLNRDESVGLHPILRSCHRQGKSMVGVPENPMSGW